MSYQLLLVIATLCQVHGTYGSKSVAMTGSYHDDKVVELEFSYRDAAREQLKCQKYFVKCAKNNGGAVEECILERK